MTVATIFVAFLLTVSHFDLCLIHLAFILLDLIPCNNAFLFIKQWILLCLVIYCSKLKK